MVLLEHKTGWLDLVRETRGDIPEKVRAEQLPAEFDSKYTCEGRVSMERWEWIICPGIR